MAYQRPLLFNRFQNNASEIQDALNVPNIRSYDLQFSSQPHIRISNRNSSFRKSTSSQFEMFKRLCCSGEDVDVGLVGSTAR